MSTPPKVEHRSNFRGFYKMIMTFSPCYFIWKNSTFTFTANFPGQRTIQWGSRAAGKGFFTSILHKPTLCEVTRFKITPVNTRGARAVVQFSLEPLKRLPAEGGRVIFFLYFLSRIAAVKIRECRENEEIE